ncbi:MAG: hypothetical protein J6Y43_08380 [Clostridia bacterium]|nr:hypothetical protein [Clostridia bacterium]
MNFIQFVGSEDFGVPAVIVALAVASTEFTLKKIKGVPDFVANWLPLFIAFFGTVLSELICKGRTDFSETLFYAAITSYSLGTVASVFARKILRGEAPSDALFALVQGIAEGVLKDGADAAISEIVAILSGVTETSGENDERLKQNVVSVLSSVKKDGVTLDEISAVAELILLSAKQFGKEK